MQDIDYFKTFFFQEVNYCEMKEILCRTFILKRMEYISNFLKLLA